jgi:hypothetical protein
LRFFHGFSFSDAMEPREDSVDEESDEESDELLLPLLMLLPNSRGGWHPGTTSSRWHGGPKGQIFRVLILQTTENHRSTCFFRPIEPYLRHFLYSTRACLTDK